MAIDTISNSELLSRTNNSSMDTISNEYTCLACSNKDCTIFTFIYIDAGSCIEQSYCTLLTVRYLKLLHMKFFWLANQGFKPSVLQ